jgi:long-chain acyl-CoA synthetase
MKNWPADVERRINYNPGQMPIFKYVQQHAIHQPEKTAINYYGHELNYRDLDLMSSRFASFLIKDNIRKGDRVALYLQNCPQYAICQIGAHKAGAIVVPCSPMFKAWELESELEQTASKIIVCQDDLFPIVSDVLPKVQIRSVITTSFQDFLPDKPKVPLHETMTAGKERVDGAIDLMEIIEDHGVLLEEPNVSIDDECLLQFTGGTTGLPKGAILTHRNQAFKTAGTAQVYKYVPEDVMLTAMPIYHIAGMLYGMTISFYRGCTLALLTRFDAESTVIAIDAFKCSKMYGTVFMNSEILDLEDIASYDLKSLRITTCTSFGVFLTQEIADRWSKITKGGCLVEVAYGLSETHTGDTFTPLDKPRIGSVGIPFYDTDFKIVDFDDPERELNLNEVGEIAIKSPAVAKGYWNRPEETSVAFREGRLYTGDMGKFDEDGYVYFLGRKKEMIKSSGYNIAPEEVEGFLMRHPAVDEAGCIPVPDPKRGESVKAFVVLNRKYSKGTTEKDLIDWSREKMAAYKYPRYVEFRKELPKTTSGKLLRRILREEEEVKGND